MSWKNIAVKVGVGDMNLVSDSVHVGKLDLFRY